MGIYSARFAAAHLASSSVSVTVPANHTYVVNTVDLSFEALGSTIGVFYGVGGIPIFAVAGSDLARGSWWGWRGRAVFNPGETFSFGTFDGVVDITASGYDLTAP